MARALLLTLGAALLGGASLWVATDGFKAITAEGARRVQIARDRPEVPVFALETMDSSWVALAAEGHVPTLVEFIYTTCPTICQTSGGDFAELRDHLQARGATARMLSISFDPEADAPPFLRDYADNHGASGDPWTVARPRPEELERLLDSFRVTVIPDGWGGWQHNIAVLLVDRQGRFSGVFDTRDFDGIARAVEAAS